MRGRVVVLHEKGHCVAEIWARLKEEGILVSLVSIYKLLKKYEHMRSVADRKRTHSISKILQSEHLNFLDETLAENDELTARQLQDMLEWRWPELKVSLCTIKHAWKHDLGWIRMHPK